MPTKEEYIGSLGLTNYKNIVTAIYDAMVAANADNVAGNSRTAFNTAIAALGAGPQSIARSMVHYIMQDATDLAKADNPEVVAKFNDFARGRISMSTNKDNVPLFRNSGKIVARGNKVYVIMDSDYTYEGKKSRMLELPVTDMAGSKFSAVSGKYAIPADAAGHITDNRLDVSGITAYYILRASPAYGKWCRDKGKLNRLQKRVAQRRRHANAKYGKVFGQTIRTAFDKKRAAMRDVNRNSRKYMRELKEKSDESGCTIVG